ncbi:D-alanyl-D-alanine carboxypeptidase/D-alanyl-D-alanine-endopeptidase [Parabacteroides sp. AM08-6]|uniref:D-alanyl-D-alanine carboxypeptidase/D-alanyl-D-alanine endopeptidase n=1 Tax=Parabacteroides sp. AM08-6 TaxID=2292053 RepID=UPI000F004739|nr:D-alanyl-D-alanine carboxypeptidase/D-alanyl-D-alanine-endopeptidase [Parabacteroides sp. AM08-6]RHJ79347.1 D-alanyl-D-alanine carboxypeptidase/D-alanyl-D-alanine-endopeptidase [Parabacteroides sp. AM08-6]
MIQNKILTLCLSICLFLPVTAQVPQPVKRLTQLPYMKGASFSLIVKDIQEGKTVYAYNPDLQVSPASVMKTVTTATALEILGGDYRFPTSLEYEGTIENGILKGNLYIKGSGDPSLGSSYLTQGSNSFMDKWIVAIQKAGIQKIEGAIISDESIFDTEGSSIKWLREDMGNYYAPGSYGISVFDNMYKLILKTGTGGTRPVIQGCEPEISIHFHNYLKTAVIPSDSAYIIGTPLANERYLHGVVPANRERYSLKGDIPDPALFLAHYLEKKLKQKGVEIESSSSCYRIEAEAGRWKEGNRTTIITTYSPTLRELASITNHVSHNLFADALIKTIGLQYKPGKNEVISSFERGIRITKAHWKKKGIDTFPLWMYDGSGLAPADKVSARFIGDLLVYMATKSLEADAFITSLPQPGLEGSVRNFLKGTKLQGKSRLKSGGITRVRSYAGYVTIEGRKYAIAVFSNNYSCSMGRMTGDLEKLLLELF